MSYSLPEHTFHSAVSLCYICKNFVLNFPTVQFLAQRILQELWSPRDTVLLT